MRLINDTVDLPTPTGLMRCGIHRPDAAGRFPVILLYSEIFQRTGPIERAARLIAGHGYAVLVPEVFHELNPIGTVLAYDDAGRDKGNADKATKPAIHYDSDNRALLDWAAAQSFCDGRFGAMGFCIGGHLAFRAALQPEIAATACFYATDLHSQGIPSAPDEHSMARLDRIGGELLMVWGQQDPHVPEAARDQIRLALRQAGKTFTWHEFNAAHAFMRDEGERYDPELALAGYQLALGLFRRVLRPV